MKRQMFCKAFDYSLNDTSYEINQYFYGINKIYYFPNNES